MSPAMTPDRPMRSWASRPAVPCTATPQPAAMVGEQPAASRAPITPASTSPLPAVARLGVATSERSSSPSGAGHHGVGPLEDHHLAPRAGRRGGGRHAGIVVVGNAGSRPRAEQARELAGVRGQHRAAPKRSPPVLFGRPARSGRRRRSQGLPQLVQRSRAPVAGWRDDAPSRARPPGRRRSAPRSPRGASRPARSARAPPRRAAWRSAPARRPGGGPHRLGRRQADKPGAGARGARPASSAAPAYSMEPATTSTRPKVPLWARPDEAAGAPRPSADVSSGDRHRLPRFADCGRSRRPWPSCARARSRR